MNIVESIRTKIADRLRQAAERARGQGELFFASLPDFVIEVPRDKAHGDLAANLAMLMSKEVKKPPRQVAEILVKRFIPEGTWVDRVEIAGPGFINFYLNPSWVYQVLPVVQQEDRGYGSSNIGNGLKVQVEFVSANPTGLLHMGNARGAALGDTIANLLQAAGYHVEREFYVNDAGNQIENFGKSLEARYLQLTGKDVVFPEEGYHGEDIIETVKNFIALEGDKAKHLSSDQLRAVLVEFALKEKLSEIKKDLENFGVVYDVWFKESSLHESGAVAEVIEYLKSKDYIYEHEGALWFKATAFGEEKDEVVIRKNGIPTYFAADIAYHKNKFDRGFDWVINIWGADHHGHVSRLKGAVEAVGYNPDKLEIVLMQLVRLFKGGEIVRMSKRTGQYVTLSELVEEVGKDAARYFFIMRSADSHLDFDLDLAKTQSSENPVFYVQYAHARICSILRQAEEQGYTVPPAGTVKLEVLTEPGEYELIRKIADLPDEVAQAATSLEPHRIARYAHDLAGLFHTFYNSCRVLTDEPEVRQARLVLVDSARITLRNVLGLLGITAPERM